MGTGDKAAPTSPAPGPRARKESWKSSRVHSLASRKRLRCSSALQRLLQPPLKTSSRRRRFSVTSRALPAAGLAEPPSLVEGQSPHLQPSRSRRKNQQRRPERARAEQPPEITTHAQSCGRPLLRNQFTARVGMRGHARVACRRARMALSALFVIITNEAGLVVE
jgi:hypothetical protein